jgi:hypothetical protein
VQEMVYAIAKKNAILAPIKSQKFVNLNRNADPVDIIYFVSKDINDRLKA